MFDWLSQCAQTDSSIKFKMFIDFFIMFCVSFACLVCIYNVFKEILINKAKNKIYNNNQQKKF